MQFSNSSARGIVAIVLATVLALVAARLTYGDSKQPYTPPVYEPPVYEPPVYEPPVYKPPKPPVYKPPSYKPPKIVHHYKHFGYQKEPSNRVTYIPVPHYQERIVEKIIEKKVYVEKPVKVTKYWVKEVHYGRCVQAAPSVVFEKPSFSSQRLGQVAPGTKMHIKQCLTDKAGKWFWCSVDIAPNTEAWVSANSIALCPN